ncbi:MAG: hypothetical protein M3279_02630 [Actinomycetota bacterium]|nr:hypothetical protein [Actinomycetota bacterium]
MPESSLPTGTHLEERRGPCDQEWAEEVQDTWDPELGAAAGILQARGHHKAAALLLDVEVLTFVDAFEDTYGNYKRACLIVHPYLVSRFDEETCNQISEAFQKACFQAGFGIADVEAFPTPAAVGWRDRLQEQLVSGPRNQGAIAPLPKQFPRADGMAFRDSAELAVYQALKLAQEARPQDDTFTIVPNCAARVPHRTWEPDFLIIFRGRCAAIEVDGGSHRRKYLTDKSRDEVLTDCGVQFVKRIDVADAGNDHELTAFVQRVLDKLARP